MTRIRENPGLPGSAWFTVSDERLDGTQDGGIIANISGKDNVSYLRPATFSA